jgi:hypothetical protein
MTYNGPERRISGQADRRAYVRALMAASDRRRGPDCTSTCQCGAVDTDDDDAVELHECSAAHPSTKGYREPWQM